MCERFNRSIFGDKKEMKKERVKFNCCNDATQSTRITTVKSIPDAEIQFIETMN